MMFKERRPVTERTAAELDAIDRRERIGGKKRGRDLAKISSRGTPRATSKTGRTWNRTDKLPTWKGWTP